MLGLLVTLVMFVRVSVPLMPPVLDRSVAVGLELSRTPVEVVVPTGKVNMCRSRFPSKFTPNDTVVVLLVVEFVVVEVVVGLTVVGEPNSVFAWLVVFELLLEPMGRPTPFVVEALPTGTFSVPATTIPFSGFGMVSWTG